MKALDPQVIILAPDSKYNMYWILPNTAADAFTHDFYHIDVRQSRMRNASLS